MFILFFFLHQIYHFKGLDNFILKSSILSINDEMWESSKAMTDDSILQLWEENPIHFVIQTDSSNNHLLSFHKKGIL